MYPNSSGFRGAKRGKKKQYNELYINNLTSPARPIPQFSQIGLDFNTFYFEYFRKFRVG